MREKQFSFSRICSCWMLFSVYRRYTLRQERELGPTALPIMKGEVGDFEALHAQIQGTALRRFIQLSDSQINMLGPHVLPVGVALSRKLDRFENNIRPAFRPASKPFAHDAAVQG